MQRSEEHHVIFQIISYDLDMTVVENILGNSFHGCEYLHKMGAVPRKCLHQNYHSTSILNAANQVKETKYHMYSFTHLRRQRSPPKVCTVDKKCSFHRIYSSLVE